MGSVLVGMEENTRLVCCLFCVVLCHFVACNLFFFFFFGKWPMMDVGLVRSTLRLRGIRARWGKRIEKRQEKCRRKMEVRMSCHAVPHAMSMLARAHTLGLGCQMGKKPSPGQSRPRRAPFGRQS